MRPNLSLSNIASTLAALGGATALIVACGGDAKPAANANEVKQATPTGTGQGSCASNGQCGAKTGNNEGDKKNEPASTTAATTTPPPTTTPTTGTAPADNKPGADPKPAATTASTSTAKPPAPMKPASGGGGTAKPKGQASCGAGTCAADPKKKM